MAQTPKRKPAVAPAPRLHGLRRPIALTLPPELVDELDAIAAAEDRTRVKTIEIACRQFVRAYRHKAAAA
jgi:metal-responsive CopG/Arc/MetJ family transcriptional regulator